MNIPEVTFKTRIGIAVAGAVYREIRVILKKRSYKLNIAKIRFQDI